MPKFTTPLLAACLLTGTAILGALTGPALGQQLALMPSGPDCPWPEPDSVQISWDAPCEQGDWLLDTQTGCRMWDWHPEPKDRAVWSGACPRGVKEGRGVLQWYEHGQPIDRFEGSYREGKRQGFGRYVWNATDLYEGQYRDDLPEGFGTATLAGKVFTGKWKRGCMRQGNHVVAIGVPRTSCTGVPTAAIDKSQAAGF